MAKRYKRKAKDPNEVARENVTRLVEQILAKETLPWRSVYDKSWLPFRAEKYLSGLAKLNKHGWDPKESAKTARVAARYRGGNLLNLMLDAQQKGIQYAVAGGMSFWKELLEHRYRDPEAAYVGIRRGERASTVMAPVTRRVSEQDESISAKRDDDKDQPSLVGFRHVPVFFVEQFDGVDFEAFLGPIEVPEPQFDLTVFTRQFAQMCQDANIPYEHGVAGNTAFYAHTPYESEAKGKVVVPPLRGFVSSEEWAAACLHELSHAVHHQIEPEAFDRHPKKDSLFEGWNEKALRAYREVVAEFSAGLSMIELGIVTPETNQNSASYVRGFADSLKTLLEADLATVVRGGAGMAAKVSERMLGDGRTLAPDVDDIIREETRARRAVVGAEIGKEPEDVTPEDFLAHMRRLVSGTGQDLADGQSPPADENRGMARVGMGR